ncbi:MAG: tetratricopeptide repeat protein [Rhodospirillaceae bacterium]
MRNVMNPSKTLAVVVLAVTLGACASGASDGSSALTTEATAFAAEPLLERADTALDEGLMEVAMGHYQVVLRHQPDNARARLGMAEINLAAGDLPAARAGFDAQTTHPELGPRAHQGMGLAYLKAGRPDKARAPLEAAVLADSFLWRAWNGLATVHDRDENWAEAHRCYEAALAAAPPGAAGIIHNNLGFSLILQGRHDEATAHLMEAARRDRTQTLPRTNLRLALAWQGRYDEAVAGARPAERATVLNNVGYVALLRGDLDDAEALLSRAIDGSASHFDPAWHNLAHLKAVRGDKI